MKVRSLFLAPALLLAAAAPALAAVPLGAQAIFTDAATDFGVIIGYGFIAMGAIVGGMIVFNLVKRIAKKSTSG